MHRSTSRLVAIVGALLVVGGLTGCSPDTPEFVPPMVWEASESYGQGESRPDHVIVEVLDDGKARLTGFPIGRSIQTDRGTYCIDGFTDRRYTGEATWEVRNRFSFWVEFDDSRVLVSGDAQFGEQDWSTIGFDACGSERRWDFAYVCGDSGYGGDNNTTTFRDECPSAG